MKIKAVILAGGQGSRLRPITCSRPKPLCNILGKSVIERLLDKLNNCDISDVVISALYMADKIIDKLSNKKYSFNLSIISEPEPLGSAGGTRYAANAISTKDDDILLILSGDGIFDFDLRSVLKYHQDKKADATIVTVNRDNPIEYGVILSHKNGKINAITEKPSWSEVKSNTVNTGIYVFNGDILKYIPTNRPFDFSKDLFPHLLWINKSLYSYNFDGYWCDIGNTSEYYKCCLELLSGEISDFSIEGGMSEEEILSKRIRCKHPCYISKTAKISPEAYIEMNSIIGDNVSIGDGTIVRSAIVFENCEIQNDAVISNSIICENSLIESNSIISSGCILGANVTVKQGAIMDEGVSIWPGKTVENSLYVSNDSIFNSNGCNLYSDEGYCAGKANENINISYFTVFGKAIASSTKAELNKKEIQRIPRIGVMHCGTGECSLIADTLICGIQSAGVQTFSFTKGFEAEAMYVASTFLLDYLLYVYCNNNERVIKVFDRNSFSPTKFFEKQFEFYINNPDTTVQSTFFDTIYVDNAKQFYFSELTRKIEREFFTDNNYAPLDGTKINLYNTRSKKSEAEAIFEKVAIHLGAQIVSEDCNDAISVRISESGLEATMQFRNKQNREFYFDTHHIIASLISNDLKNGKGYAYSSEIIYSIYEDVLNSMDNDIVTNKNEIKNKNNFPWEKRWIKDMCYSLLKLLCIINNQHSEIDEFISKLPPFEIRIRNITTDEVGGEKRANVMKHLYNKYGYAENSLLRDGISISLRDGNVTVIPRKSGGFKLITNSVDSECADALFDEILYEIKKIK